MSKLHDLKQRFDEITAEKAKGPPGAHLQSASPDAWPINNKLFTTLLEVLEEQANEIARLKEMVGPYSGSKARDNRFLRNDNEGQK